MATIERTKEKNQSDSVALSEREAACYIGMSQGFLRQDRMDGYRINRTPGPHFIKIGRTIRYLKSDLEAWLNQHRVTRKYP